MYTIVYVRLYDSTRVIEYCVYIDHISCMKVYILEYTEKNKCSLDRARAGSDRVSGLTAKVRQQILESKNHGSASVCVNLGKMTQGNERGASGSFGVRW